MRPQFIRHRPPILPSPPTLLVLSKDRPASLPLLLLLLRPRSFFIFLFFVDTPAGLWGSGQLLAIRVLTCYCCCRRCCVLTGRSLALFAVSSVALVLLDSHEDTPSGLLLRLLVLHDLEGVALLGRHSWFLFLLLRSGSLLRSKCPRVGQRRCNVVRFASDA